MKTKPDSLLPRRHVSSFVIRRSALAFALTAALLLAAPLARAQVVTTTADVGVGSLRAVVAAPTTTNGATITFTNTLSGQSIQLDSTLVLDKNLTIDASALPAGIKLLGNGRVLEVPAGRTVMLRALEVRNGYQTQGGGIYNAGTLTLDGCTLANNGDGTPFGGGFTAQGGGIYNAGTLTLNQCTLTGNFANEGAAIYNQIGASLTVNHSTITDNFGNSGPGGIRNLGALTLNNTFLSGNIGGGSDPNLHNTGNLTVVVTTTEDAVTGSLRERLASYPGAQIITFATNLSGQTLALSSGEIALNTSLAIDASALPGRVTLDGNGNSRLFNIGASGMVTLDSLTLTNGRATGDHGGAIHNGGVLTVNRCTVAGNTATLDGGGIFNPAGSRLTLLNSTFTGNTAREGGAVRCTGATFAATNCTFTASTASIGGACSIADGGPDARLSHVTVAGNQATDVTYGGGGLFLYAQNATLHNSIIAGNTAPTGPDIGTVGSTISATGTNLLGNLAGSGLSAGPTIIIGNPLLAPLGSYGGPTPTMPPLPGSPAIDAGGATSLATDQRGLPRIAGLSADLGAVEVGSAIPGYTYGTVVNTTNDFLSGLETNLVSLRNALAFAPANATITFTNTLSGQIIRLTRGSLLLNRSLNLDASALVNGIAISGNATNRVFDSVSGITNVFTALTITNGAVAGSASGGGILSRGHLTLTRCTLAGNSASNSGGGIYNGGVLTLNQCTLAGNSSPTSGGGIYNHNAGTLAVNQSTLAGNSATIVGGGIHNEGMLTVNQSTFSGNSASAAGGIYNNNAGTLKLTNSIVAGNPTAGQGDQSISGAGSFTGRNNLTNGNPLLAPLGNYGGPTMTMPPLTGSPAIDAAGATLFATDQRGFPRIAGPSADLGAVEAGHAIPGYTYGTVVNTTNDFLNGAETNLVSLRNALAFAPTNATITFAPGLSGQTIVLASGPLILNRSLNIDASALANGIAISGNGTNRVFDSISGITNVLTALTMTNGAAAGSASGGGILSRGHLTLTRCTLAGNSTGSAGGAIYNEGALTLNQCTLSGNSANFGGGILNHNAGTLAVNQSTLSGNSAVFGGGIDNQGTLNLSNSIVAGNNGGNVNGSFSGSHNLTNANPLLAPLGNYGGPTPTMPPLPNSPAIDGCIHGSSFATDQRGLPRIVGPFADLGAVEANLNPVVTTLADSGPGSLRQVMAGAIPGSTITFTNTLSGQTIPLINGSLVLNRSLNIDASALANGIAIKGTGTYGVFDSVPGITNVFTALTITNGVAAPPAVGGGIVSRGHLTLNRCTLVGNSASSGGAIYNQGTLTVNQSTLAGNTAPNFGGGAIYNEGTLAANQSTLSGNSAGLEGGGIYNVGTLTVNQSTLEGNSADLGGGILNRNGGALTVNQSTLAGNSADAGGGIANYGTLNLTNSIVAGNTAAVLPNISSNIPIPGNPNLTDGDPLLAPLGNYGGPTQTMPPLPGSPAIDAGGATTLTTDQRGLPRIAGPSADLGAVEAGQAIPGYTYGSVVNTTNDFLNGAETNVVSLRNALAFAPANATITFAPGLSGQTITLTSGSLVLNRSLNIDASALANGIAINGNGTGTYGVFDSVPGITNVFTALTITNGVAHPAAGGGGIVSRGHLTLNRCTLVGNSAGSGGAIYNESTLTVNQSTISENSVNGNVGGGGGIYNQGTLTVNQSTISKNSASGLPGIGGGIYNAGALNLTNSIVAGNFADINPDLYGSYASNNNLTDGNPLLAPLGNYGGPTPTMPPLPNSPAIDGCIHGSSFATDQRGLPRIVGPFADLGAVEADFNPVVTTLADSGPGSLRQVMAEAIPGATTTFTYTLSGQTIVLTRGPLILNRSLNIDASALANSIAISGNGAYRVFDSISGITNVFTALTITNGVVPYPASGGGIYSHGHLTLNRCTISGNSAGFTGGGIYNTGTLAVNQSTLSGNSADNGGGILNYGTLTVNQSTLSGNSADYGGGIYNNGASLTVNQSTLSGNSSRGVGGAAGGGGIYNQGPLTVNQSTISGNSAYNGGGILSLAQFSLTNSIVAGNIASIATNISGSISGIHNLTYGNPLLAPLGNYGGPTMTMPPLPNSPALNGCTNGTSFVVDQRGLPRIVGLFADLGAVEANFNPVVTTLADSGPGSLRQVMAEASPGATITFVPGLPGQTILLTSGSLWLNRSLNMDASALASGIAIRGDGTNRVFDSVTGITNVFTALTITNGRSSDGGGILSFGHLTLNRCTLSGNSAHIGGGGIANYGTLTVNQSTLSGNRAYIAGGIYNVGTLTVNQSTLSGNSTFSGGGIANYDTLTVNQSTLSGNSAYNGGGILNAGALDLNNSIVAGNTSQNGPNIDGYIPISGSHNLTDGIPLLAPLGNYGGPTMTMPPLTGSPALNAGGTTTLTTDQRGFARVIGAAMDLGAVEGAFDPAIPLGRPTPEFVSGRLSTLRFNFTNLSGPAYAVYASTNVAAPFNTWVNLGPAVETLPGSGQYQFTDLQATNHPQRFYRVLLP